MPYKDKEKYKEYHKEYYQKNKEEKKEYYENNKEKITEYKKEWYKKNKEKIKDRVKEWYENNKEKIKEYKKEYNQSENGKKRHTISGWKTRGLVCDDYNELYDKYIIAEKCEECGIKFEEGDKNKKCMDHDHSTGLFRNFLCNSCNVKRG